MRYQIAQKLHAGSDPHEPPAYVNDRARDLVDLLLLKQLAESTGEPNTPISTKTSAIRTIHPPSQYPTPPQRNTRIRTTKLKALRQAPARPPGTTI
jgi:hypothetical protein